MTVPEQRAYCNGQAQDAARFAIRALETCDYEEAAARLGAALVHVEQCLVLLQLAAETAPNAYLTPATAALGSVHE